MDAVRRMVSDHKTVDDLLNRLLSAPNPDGRVELADEFTRRLRAHVHAADELLVPVFKERATRADLERLDGWDDIETRLVEDLEQLARVGPADPGFEAHLGRVREDLTRHVDLEESLILPRTEDLLSDKELIELGGRIERFEQARLRMSGLRARLTLPTKESMPFDPVKLARTVGIILAAGVLLAVWDQLGRTRMRTSGPIAARS